MFGTPKTRKSVNLIVGELDESAKASLISALGEQQFEQVQHSSGGDDLRKQVADSSPDVVIIDGNMDGDVVQAIHDIRRGLVGINPFVSIILTSWTNKVDAIKRMIDAGADEVLLKPLAPANLLDRLSALATRRRPFIATETYVGPDRGDGRIDSSIDTGPPIHPPNTFKAKLEGKPIPRDELVKLVKQAQSGLSEQRVQRDVGRVAKLVAAVQEAEETGRRDDALRATLDELAHLAVFLKNDLTRSPLQDFAQLAANLARAAVDLRDRLPELDRKNLQLLQPLSDALNKGLSLPEARRKLAEITSMVSKFQADRDR